MKCVALVYTVSYLVRTKRGIVHMFEEYVIVLVCDLSA